MRRWILNRKRDLQRIRCQCGHRYHEIRDNMINLIRKINKLATHRLVLPALLVLVWILCAIVGCHVLYLHRQIPYFEFTYPKEMDFISMYKKFKNHENLPSPDGQINPHPFHYIHLKQKCHFQSANETSLLILVKSATNNVHLRDGIRATWGKASGGNIEIVYILGYRAENQLLIDEEAYVNGDIIQESFIDAYRNNTYKTIMGFNWAVQYCSEASHMIFVDDDHYLVLSNIRIYINNLYRSNDFNLMVGYVYFAAKPQRYSVSKWYVTLEDYPFDTYPPYVTGGAYLVSREVADKLVFAFPYVKYLWIDDVYLGIVSHKFGIVPQHEPRLYQPSFLLHTEPTHMVYHDFKTKEAFINVEEFLRGFPIVLPASKKCRYSWRCLASL